MRSCHKRERNCYWVWYQLGKKIIPLLFSLTVWLPARCAHIVCHNQIWKRRKMATSCVSNTFNLISVRKNCTLNYMLLLMHHQSSLPLCCPIIMIINKGKHWVFSFFPRITFISDNSCKEMQIASNTPHGHEKSQNHYNLNTGKFIPSDQWPQSTYFQTAVMCRAN